MFCFVVGTNLGSVFEVEGNAGMSVSKLKVEIYEMNKNDFEDKKFDANKLDLWLVDIPYDTENVKLRTLQSRSLDEENIIKELGGKELSPVDDIGDIFKCDSKNIRIIVRPPANTVSPMYIPSNELKTEIKDKVIKAFPRVKTSSIEQLIDALALIWDVEAVERDPPSSQNDPCVKLKTEPSFFKINLPGTINKKFPSTVDLRLPPYESKSGMSYLNPFYDDPQFKETVSLLREKLIEHPDDITVLAGVSGGGKTSTAFGFAMDYWSIYIDFSPSGRSKSYIDIIGLELETIRAKPPMYRQTDEQSKVFDMLDLAIVSQGLLLIKMLAQGKISTQKEWLFAQLQTDGYEIRNILNTKDFKIKTLIQKINACLGMECLILIFDEAQVLCKPEYGKYDGSSSDGKEWNLLQAYIEHLTHLDVTCLLAGTYMHIASGISLVTSVGKEGLNDHIVLKLPFLSHYDVLRNLEAVIDLKNVSPGIRNYLGYLLKGRPRNCASFVQMLISNRVPTSRTKDQEIFELVELWFEKICNDMAIYFKNACEYLGANNSNPETAIMDVLRLRVFYNHKYKEAIKLLQHSIIPCKSPEYITIGPEREFITPDSKVRTSCTIEVNESLESYLVASIELFLKKTRNKTLIDVFIDNIIRLNNIQLIGNEFDAVFITAIIQKYMFNAREELNRWKNGQQFDLPPWITPTMKFVTISNISGAVPISKYVDDKAYRYYAIQPEIYSGSDLVVSLVDDEQNVVLLSASCTVSGSVIKRDKVKKQLIKSCMKFQYMECPRKRKKSETASYKKRQCLQIGLGEIPDVTTADEENDSEEEEEEEEEEKEEEEEYGKDLKFNGVDYDLDYTENTKNYKISRISERAENHGKIKTSTENQRHIYVSVELPHRQGKKRPRLFRINEYGDLVIIVDDRNIEYVFGTAIKKLMERISENQENLMDETDG